MNNLNRICIFWCILLFSTTLSAQLTGLSAGLAFSSGVEYNIPGTDNIATTGNPGVFGKVFLKVGKRFHIVPSGVVFNPYKKSDINSYKLYIYMFQGDIDGVYGIFKDNNLRVLGFAGFNATAIRLKYDIMQNTAFTDLLENSSEIKAGVNLGGALQLYVNDSFDGYISAKYILSSFDQLVINLGAIYYIGGKHRKGSW